MSLHKKKQHAQTIPSPHVRRKDKVFEQQNSHWAIISPAKRQTSLQNFCTLNYTDTNFRLLSVFPASNVGEENKWRITGNGKRAIQVTK